MWLYVCRYTKEKEKKTEKERNKRKRMKVKEKEWKWERNTEKKRESNEKAYFKTNLISSGLIAVD